MYVIYVGDFMQLVMDSALTSGALIKIGGRACYFSFIVIIHYRLGFPVGIQFYFRNQIGPWLILPAPGGCSTGL